MDRKFEFEYSRKAVHLLSLFVPLIAYFSIPLAQILLLFLMALYSFAEVKKIKGQQFFLNPLIQKMQREHERSQFAKAPLFLALGVLCALSFFSLKAAVIGIYQVGLCDTAAAYFGKKWGGTAFPFWERKTYTGMLAFLVFSLPVCFFFLPPSKAIALSMVGAFLESIPVKDWDNLMIPIVGAFLAQQFIL